MRPYLFHIFLIVLLFQIPVLAQETENGEEEDNNEDIEILNAETLEYYKKLGEFQILKGNVVFRHDEALMYCDSAYYYEERNSLEAFSKVYIRQGDSLHMYGDFLRYDGGTKIAKFRKNVKLVDNDMTILTDSLDYDRNINVGFYEHGGTIIDNENDLASRKGRYFSDEKIVHFKDSVVLINPQYTMYSDTLHYNTSSEISYFFGPTTIVSDSSTIYCENGWYDTQNDVSQFSENAWLQSKAQTLSGDSLFYNRREAFGEAFRNVELVDTVEQIILNGEYGIYYQNPDRSYVTDSAMFTHIVDGDSLFLHSDTLRMHSFTDTINMRLPYTFPDSLTPEMLFYIDTASGDTLQKRIDTVYLQIPDTTFIYPDDMPEDIVDSLKIPSDTLVNYTPDTAYFHYVDSVKEFKLVRGYYRSKLFKSDFQGKCDSLVYSTRDSIMQLYHEPILWSEENQLTAEFIEMHTSNNDVDEVYMYENAMIIAQEDSIRYNQIKGKNMVGYIIESELKRINVDGNSQALYFIKDEGDDEESEVDDELLGVNKVESSKMVIFMKEGEVDMIHFKPSSDGKVTPLDHEPPKKLRLEGFNWQDYHRPKVLMDIYLWSGYTRFDLYKKVENDESEENTESSENESSNENTEGNSTEETQIIEEEIIEEEEID